MTEYDDFSRNMKILFEEIRRTFEVCRNQHDGKKLKKLIEETVKAHNLLNGLRQELYYKAISQDIKERKNTMKAADYVHKVQERLKKIIDEMKPYLPIFVREEEKEKPLEEDEEARKRWDRFLKAKGKLKEALDAAHDAKVSEEKLKNAIDALKAAEKIEKDEKPIHDQQIDTIEDMTKHVHRIIEEQGESKKKHEEKKARILDRIKELRENVKEAGLDKETQGKVDKAEEWLGRASPDDFGKIEQQLNRITEVVEKVKPINEKLSEKIEEAKKLGLPEAESGSKILKEGTSGQKQQITEEINSAIERAKKQKKPEEGKEEVPEEIPAHIVDLYTEFTRNLGNKDRGAYHYTLRVMDKAFPKNVPGYKSLPKDKTRKLRDIRGAATRFVNIYNTIHPKLLNERAFYDFLIYLAGLGKRRVIWVSWFRELPESIDEIKRTKEALKKERDENAKEEKVSKDLLERYDLIINELLGSATMKLLDNLGVIYHNVIKEGEELKPKK